MLRVVLDSWDVKQNWSLLVVRIDGRLFTLSAHLDMKIIAVSRSQCWRVWLVSRRYSFGNCRVCWLSLRCFIFLQFMLTDGGRRKGRNEGVENNELKCIRVAELEDNGILPPTLYPDESIFREFSFNGTPCSTMHKRYIGNVKSIRLYVMELTVLTEYSLLKKGNYIIDWLKSFSSFGTVAKSIVTFKVTTV